jgi:hypothetical protein
MMSKREIQYEVFNCSKMGAKVKITREVLIHRSSGTGEIDAKFTTSIDCDHKTDCGVGKASGLSISYDWTKCVHPDLK